jgi:hypothetical protein
MLKKSDLWNITASLPAEDVEIFDSNGVLSGTIRMRGLSAAELTAYQESLVIQLSSGARRQNARRAIAKLIVACAINDDGSPYFETSDIPKLDEAPARMLMPLFESAQKLCGLTDDDMNQLTENFGETRSESSNSD